MNISCTLAPWHCSQSANPVFLSSGLSSKETIHYLKEMDEQTFLTELQNKFGTRAGKFRKILSQRASYPLELSRLKKFVRPRVVVVGNASHTVHPVAGQGFNLALRDVAALADVLPKSSSLGMGYWQLRRTFTL